MQSPSLVNPSPALAAGVQVRILPGINNEVRIKHPNLVGKIGVIESIPSGGEETYTVRINISTSSSASKAQIVKLKEDSFAPLSPEKQRNVGALSSEAAAAKTPTHSMKVKGEKNVMTGKVQNRPRSNSSPGLSNAAFAALKAGSKVSIIGTETVLQRLPQLVGRIGIIREAPVHPATWFKVEFLPEHRVLTFRPSALRPVDDDGKPIHFPTQSTGSSSSMKPNKEKTSSKAQGNKANIKDDRRKVTKDEPDTWIGKYVTIVGGRNAGQQAKVIGYGNGWVQLRAGTGEVIPKRAFELQLLDDNQVELTMEDDQQDRRSAKRQRTSRHGSSGRGKNGLLDDTQISDEGRTILPYKYSSGIGVDINQGTSSSAFIESLRNAPSSGVRFSAVNPVVEELSGRRARAYSDSLMNTSPTGPGGTYSFQMFSSATSEILPAAQLFQTALAEHLERRRKEYPILSSSTVDAKKAFVMKYVNRHLAKISNRPHLVDWRQQFDVSLSNDRFFEAQAARLFEESYCEVCNLEKWPNAKFCWNEGCPVSPVYYKLTGIQTAEDDITAKNTAANSMPPLDTDALSASGHSVLNSLNMLPVGSTKAVHFGGNSIDQRSDGIDVFPNVILSKDRSSAAYYPLQLHPQLNLINDYLFNYPSAIIGGNEPPGTAPDIPEQPVQRQGRKGMGSKERKTSSASAKKGKQISQAVVAREDTIPLTVKSAQPEMMGLAAISTAHPVHLDRARNELPPVASDQSNRFSQLNTSIASADRNALISPSITSASAVISQFAFDNSGKDNNQQAHNMSVEKKDQHPPGQVVYTQYYYKDSRSDSMGDTDCENRSPPTVALKDPAIAAGVSGMTAADEDTMSELALPKVASVNSMDALANSGEKISGDISM